MKPKSSLIMFRDYFLGFVLYLSLFLIINPGLVVIGSYAGASQLF